MSMSLQDRLKGRTAFVTGGGGGIGRAVCERLAAEGAAVVVADIGLEPAERVASALRDGGAVSHAVQLDVSDRASWEAAVAALPEPVRAVDILVNVAGIVRDRSLVKMSDAEWTTVLDVNLRGTWLGCQTAFKLVGDRGWGRIVNIASTAMLGTFGQANYSASKAGVVGLTRTAALEGARRGILVNAVAPGVVETSIVEGVPDAIRAQWVEKTPIGRLGKPQEIASIVAFLASDDAAYVTGQTIVADGGATTGDY
ncbi:3-oxoacyl-[acyl-carrier protein] reductase [Azospirillum agricola]|uniref:SDR family oxidoreductase n=1 Tax=Azospirillum agricola TaxID=1720247 RepID=UPI001AE9FCAB|nr:SDR family oxidoreductase [Azospirillum agricola]MBP2227831.1 3-oxoacyl-[acyl-carrier protein] reductase [Azospirillum agricola]